MSERTMFEDRTIKYRVSGGRMEKNKEMAGKIGFWKDKIKDCPDLDWFQSNEYWACLKYLQAGRRHKGYKGWANCRICGIRLGTYDMITPDGKWIFPERYDHYLIGHKIKPNKKQFIKDAVRWYRNNI